MLAVVTWEGDRVGHMAYQESLDLRILAPGRVRPQSEIDLSNRINLIAANRTTLAEKAPAPSYAIAFFSSPVGYFGDRCLRINRAKFARYGIEEPDYVKSADYPIAVRGEALWTDPKKFRAGLPEAVRMVILLCNRRQRKKEGKAYREKPLAIISPAFPQA